MSIRKFKVNVFNKNQGQIRVGQSLTGQGVELTVQLYETIIVSYLVNHVGPSPIIKLNSGGYKTATTKASINHTLKELSLPWQVFQKKGQWYITNGVKTIEFTDGIELNASDAIKEAI